MGIGGTERPRGWRRVLRVFAASLATLLTLAVVAAVLSNKPRPRGEPGPEAEKLAREMAAAVDLQAWKNTGAVRFTFLGHRHLWDRRRGFDLLESGNRRVLLRISGRTGRVWENGREVPEERATKLVRDAYAAWVNDSFWLNPVVKLFDTGVTHGIVRDEDGANHLLAEYSSGGVTPGDAYLWTPGKSGAPPGEWRMWVHVIPIGGVRASWEGWTRLSTGARVSTLHRLGPFTIRLKDVAGAATLAELQGAANDPFQALVTPR